MIYHNAVKKVLFLIFLTFFSIHCYSQKDSLAKTFTKPDSLSIELAGKVSEYFSRGTELANQYKYVQAEEYFDKCIAIDHKSYELYFNRGVCKTHLHDYESAINDFNKAMDLHLQGPFMFGLYFRGYCYNKLKHFDLAIADLTAAIDLGTSADNWAERGYAYLQTGDFQNAASDYTSAIAIDTLHVEWYGSRAICEYKDHHLADAVKDAEKYLKKNPNEADIVEIEMRAKYEMPDYPGALVLAKRLVKLRRTKLSYYYKGLIEFYMQDYTSAIVDFTSAIRLDENYRDAYYCRGISYLGLNDDKHACPDLLKANRMGFPGLDGKIQKYCKDYKGK